MNEEMTVSPDSIDDFLSSLIVGGRAANTVKAYRADLAPIRSQLPDSCSLSAVEAICAEHLTQGRRSGWANGTTRRKLSAMRQFGKWAGDPDFLGDYRPPPKTRHSSHPVEGLMEGVRAMIEVANGDDQRALVTLCGYLGLRVSEARMVRPSHFIFKPDANGVEQCLLKVKGKGEREREIPVPREAFHLIRPRAAQVATTDDRLYAGGDSAARALISRIGKRAHVGHVASHDLRHTVGTVVVQTAGIRVAQEILGHADPAQTATYSLVSESDKRAAMTAAVSQGGNP